MGISNDRELLAIASYSRHPPVPNLLLASVHFLLLKGSNHKLSSFYPDLNRSPDQSDPYPEFRAFCLDYRETIRDLLRTYLVQTNEAQRSALLLPAYQAIASQTKRPLALVEIGASAGLNLLWDRYAYDYGDGRIYGDIESEVKLECSLRGQLLPPSVEDFPRSGFGVGIDLNPLDVHNEDDTRWLRALVWPEHRKRMRLLESAVRVGRRHPLNLLRGDALDVLPEALQMTPDDCTAVVLSTFTLNQFSKESREKLSPTRATRAPERTPSRVYRIRRQRSASRASRCALQRWKERGQSLSQMRASWGVARMGISARTRPFISVQLAGGTISG